MVGWEDRLLNDPYCIDWDDHWHAMQGPHHAGVMQTPLAAHQRASQVQSGMPGSPVAVRAGACLLGR